MILFVAFIFLGSPRCSGSYELMLMRLARLRMA